ncbi:MAG: HD domain-containing protein [Oscillospiraceae bacterium]|nr:HD domain-containing protein [Oscillospiraceae bacterium]
MDEQTAALVAAMTEYDRGDAKRIQHFIKVHDLAAVIGRSEGLDDETLFVLETAAVLHDIGIHISEEKYGSSGGKYQEIEGPAEADKLMKAVGGYTPEQIERVKYLIAHHHTYTDIVGLDYQILVEADFLVNLFEDSAKHSTAISVRDKIFKTETGLKLLSDMFGL